MNKIYFYSFLLLNYLSVLTFIYSDENDLLQKKEYSDKFWSFSIQVPKDWAIVENQKISNAAKAIIIADSGYSTIGVSITDYTKSFEDTNLSRESVAVLVEENLNDIYGSLKDQIKSTGWEILSEGYELINNKRFQFYEYKVSNNGKKIIQKQFYYHNDAILYLLQVSHLDGYYSEFKLLNLSKESFIIE